MKRANWNRYLAAGALAALPAVALADISPQEVEELRAAIRKQQVVIDQQQDRLRTLERTEQQTWLNERRAQEVKTLIHESLSDADTRASFQDNASLNVGYKSGFFIASDDGNFLLRTNVLGQIRYVYSDSKNTGGGIGVTPTPPGGDENTNGFSLRNYRLDCLLHCRPPSRASRWWRSTPATDGSASTSNHLASKLRIRHLA